MNNQPARALATDTLEETFSSDFRTAERQPSVDATATENEYATPSDTKASEPRTADRWWLRKRVMGF